MGVGVGAIVGVAVGIGVGARVGVADGGAAGSDVALTTDSAVVVGGAVAVAVS